MRQVTISPRIRRAIAAALILPLIAACEGRGAPTPVEAAAPPPSLSRGGSPGKSLAGTSSPMAISPASATLAVGQATTLHVDYFDSRGTLVAPEDFRWTYYGCIAAAPANAYCYDIVGVAPVSPLLRDVVITGRAAGTVQIYADDGLGHRVSTQVTVQGAGAALVQ